MNTTYHYVVLRLATDDLRGELINVGVVLFPQNDVPRVIVMATLNKLRALDATWDSIRFSKWIEGVRYLVEKESSSARIVASLGRFHYCDPEAVGSFMATSKAEVDAAIADIKTTYVANKSGVEKVPKEKKQRLQTLLKEQFRQMQVLGNDHDDIAAHLVVPNVPVPSHPELKNDFVYKNGAYRITQTLDYRVSADSVHNKLAEACVKSTAAELALKDYGTGTLRLAVMDIPEGLQDAVDSHIDLLLAQGFEVFQYGDPKSMADYLTKGAP